MRFEALLGTSSGLFSNSRTTASRNVKQFRGGLVLKAYRLLHHSSLGWRVIKKREEHAQRLLDGKGQDLDKVAGGPHPAPCTLHPAPCTLTLHPAPCTLHPQAPRRQGSGPRQGHRALGSRVQGQGPGSGSRVQGQGPGSRCRVRGAGSRVQVCRVSGLGRGVTHA